MLLKLANITDGGQIDGGVVPVGVGVVLPVGVGVKVGVMLPVEVGVGVVGRLPVGVGVKVGVMLPVEVGVGVVVRLPVGVGVCVGVLVPLEVTARLRNTTMVCEAAFPCTIVTRMVRAFKFLLIKRSAGIVYISVTE